jgi:hypothetical protein
MKVTRTRAFALLTVAVLWAITPAMACVLPGATMTPAERECCHQMAEQCGSSMMPASHSCCKAQGPNKHRSSPGPGCRTGSSPHHCCDTSGRILSGIARSDSALPSFVSPCPTSRTISRL